MKRIRYAKETLRCFMTGTVWTKASVLLWGAGCLSRGDRLRGCLYFLEEAALLLIIALTMPYLGKLPTLGTVQAQRIWDPARRQNVWNDYDNSFLILLFGVVGLLALTAFVLQCLRMLRRARAAEQESPSPLLPRLLNEDFHRTLLVLPVSGALLVLAVPLLVMVLVAFTNYDRSHLAPTHLFTWVGLDNFRQLTGLGGAAFGYALPRVLGWTLIWAVTATLSCYIAGLLLAMFINHGRTRARRFHRSCFMAAMAVPQFVSLLLVRNLLADVGLINTLLKNWGVTDWLHSVGAIPTPNYIPFLTHPAWARPMILLINLWIGAPWQMMVATGVLLNIPKELAEAARIDGAGPIAVFRRITLPYFLQVTGPGLITGMVTNINNFGVIWLLTRDVYVTTDQMLATAGATEVDLLVTWLYRLTQDQSNYKMASVIGLIVFLLCSGFSLAALIRLNRNGREEAFQ